MADTAAQKSAPPQRQLDYGRPHRLYFTLGICNIVVLCSGMLLHHNLMSQYTDSVHVNRRWATRIAFCNELADFAMRVNSPGNDVFESGNVQAESARLEAALLAFNDHWHAVKREAEKNLRPDEVPLAATLLNEMREYTQRMAKEARMIFVHLVNKKHEEAGQRMANMDRMFSKFNSTLSRLTDFLSTSQQIEFQSQLLTAERMQRWEFGIGALILFLVVGIMNYGLRLAATFRIAEEERERTSRALQQQSEMLRDQNEQLRVTQQQAEVATQSKSAFLANMSHEIRTPMTAILGYAELLRDDLMKTENTRHREALEIIKRNGEYLLQIINDILDLSKVEAGKLVLECIAFSPFEVVADAASLMRSRARGKGLTLDVAYLSPIPERVKCDPTRLRQVLINLLGNGIKFTEIGSVRLSARHFRDEQSVDRLEFIVSDTGIGMTREQISRLFQPFTQADESTTRVFGGTGLGLTICKRLVELMGGEITVTSELGRGTEFRVSIPTGDLTDVALVECPTEAEADATPQPSHKPKLELPTLRGRILLAEDGPDNQRLIAFVLKKAGAMVDVVENGMLAVERAMLEYENGTPFDTILMDMQMPVLDGYDATRKLRNQGYRGTIIALTANAMATDRKKCLDAGCDDYATKPIDRQQLITTIHSYIHKAQAAPAAEAEAVKTPESETS